MGPADLAEELGRLLPVLVRHARTLVDATTAQDVAAEAIARTLEAIRAGRGPERNLRAYPIRAVKNCAVDTFRRASRGEILVGSIDDELLHSSPAWPESRLVFARAWGSLPLRWQMVLHMLYLEGLTRGEVAAAMDISLAAVSQLAMRARQGLHAALEDSGESPGQPGRRRSA